MLHKSSVKQSKTLTCTSPSASLCSLASGLTSSSASWGSESASESSPSSACKSKRVTGEGFGIRVIIKASFSLFEERICCSHQNQWHHSLIPEQKYQENKIEVNRQSDSVLFQIKIHGKSQKHLCMVKGQTTKQGMKKYVRVLTSSSFFFSASSKAAFSAYNIIISHASAKRQLFLYLKWGC